jgi:pyridoxamine 5'-phosphate oxidase
MELSQLRKEYLLKSLDEKDLLKNPMDQFKLWLEDAISHRICEPTAMALATSTMDGHPSCRIVLLKHLDKDGFIFFTN